MDEVLLSFVVRFQKNKIEEKMVNKFSYIDLIEDAKEMINTGFNVSEKISEDKIIKLKSMVKNKEEFIYFYRKMNDLWCDEDVFKAIEIKIENDKKSVINNPQHTNKEITLKRIEEYKVKLIDEFNALLNDKWEY